ncbi:MAG: hypothetical protein H9Q65_04445 [Spiroplasma ixodetis]|nr:hypothetical protein [Spiroplasma ixodetis]MBP1527261.1 hypothetical protein [Spiroplasma ixodetis]MBP1528472.1 hypothetical protein [Spiroplasma ixodetis]
MENKTKSQTYNFLLENKTIEDIKQQPDILVKEIKKKRHGGKTYRIDNVNHQLVNHDLSKNNRKNLKSVTSNLINEVKEQEINNDIWTKFKNYLNWSTLYIEEISKLQSIIKEKEKEIEQLKNQIEELNKPKQGNINFDDFKYNAITIYDEKQRKKRKIKKIHEEILPIEDKLFFITTFVHTDNSISEQIIYFTNSIENKFIVKQQTKYYKNISEYKSNIFLIDEQNQNLNKKRIKDFLKKQQDFKLKPTKTEKTLWCIFTVVTLLIVTSTLLLLVPPIASISIIAIAIKATAGFMGGIRIFASLFSSATRKVDVWFGNKLYKNKEQKEKEKKERHSLIKNLTSDKQETRLQTQYDILKQELDNKKNKNPYELINSKTIKHNSNNILESPIIESENKNNFDSSIRNTVNNQNQQPTTISKNDWNKVKCLFT